MKKILLFLCALSICLSTNTPVFAQFEAYTVEALGSTNIKTSFDFNETPYLFVRASDGDFKTIHSFWTNPAGSSTYNVSDNGSDDLYWLELTNWSTIKAVGDWDIQVEASTFIRNNEVNFSENVSFTVTPEPLSMVLFAVGGSPIALSLYRKRKKLIV